MKKLKSIVRSIIEYPYKKYLDWKIHRIKVNRRKLINVKYSISIWDLLIFYIILLGIITISLAVFIAVFLILRDIMT